jgi:hypothetical protein
MRSWWQLRWKGLPPPPRHHLMIEFMSWGGEKSLALLSSVQDHVSLVGLPYRIFAWCLFGDEYRAALDRQVEGYLSFMRAFGSVIWPSWCTWTWTWKSDHRWNVQGSAAVPSFASIKWNSLWEAIVSPQGAAEYRKEGHAVGSLPGIPRTAGGKGLSSSNDLQGFVQCSHW